jgi:hypothetical protein
VAWPDNTNSLGPTDTVVGDYHGESVYAWYFKEGNYWIAYVLSIPNFVGAGFTSGEAGEQFFLYIDKIISVELYAEQVAMAQQEAALHPAPPILLPMPAQAEAMMK